jgi:beta-fructofuranosidase
MHVTGFRDPSPWRQGREWYCVVASGQPQVGGNVLLYKSADLRNWQYLHPLAEGKWSGKPGTNPVDTGEMWECPDFFPLDGKHVLIHSTEGRTMWQSGTLDSAAMLFHAEHEGILDHGSYYAPKTQLDAQGKRILWGWINESRPDAEFSRAGWSGMMSLPRRLSLQDGQLIMEPAAPVASLRAEARTGAAVAQLPSAAQELRLALEPATGAPPLQQRFTDPQGTALLLRADPQQAPGTVRISNKDVEKAKQITGIAEGPLDLHLFLDHSVAEIFFNHRDAMTQRYYARSKDEAAVTITLGGNWRIAQQQAWSLRSIW